VWCAGASDVGQRYGQLVGRALCAVGSLRSRFPDSGAAEESVCRTEDFTCLLPDVLSRRCARSFSCAAVCLKFASCSSIEWQATGGTSRVFKGLQGFDNITMMLCACEISALWRHQLPNVTHGTRSQWSRLCQSHPICQSQSHAADLESLCSCSGGGPSPLNQQELLWLSASMYNLGIGLVEGGRPAAGAGPLAVAANAALAATGAAAGELDSQVRNFSAMSRDRIRLLARR